LRGGAIWTWHCRLAGRSENHSGKGFSFSRGDSIFNILVEGVGCTGGKDNLEFNFWPAGLGVDNLNPDWRSKLNATLPRGKRVRDVLGF
jgi:hypothetical protein